MSQGFPSQRLGVNVSAGTGLAQTGTVVLSNSNGVSFGMQSSAGSLVVTASAAQGTTVSYLGEAGGYAFANGYDNAKISFYRYPQPFYVRATQGRYLLSISALVNSVLSSEGFTFSIGVYTMSGSTMSLASSASRTMSFAAGGWTTGNQFRVVTDGLTFNYTPGDYMFAMWARTTNNAAALSFYGLSSNNVGAGGDGIVDTEQFINGYSTSSFTTAMPASVHITNTQYVRTGASAQRQPSFVFLGT